MTLSPVVAELINHIIQLEAEVVRLTKELAERPPKEKALDAQDQESN